jgi:hypothetical protein
MHEPQNTHKAPTGPSQSIRKPIQKHAERAFAQHSATHNKPPLSTHKDSRSTTEHPQTLTKHSQSIHTALTGPSKSTHKLANEPVKPIDLFEQLLMQTCHRSADDQSKFGRAQHCKSWHNYCMSHVPRCNIQSNLVTHDVQTSIPPNVGTENLRNIK